MESPSQTLEVSELRAWYGRSQALWGIDFTLGAGQGLGIIGRNGAGKSTLLRTIAGVHSSRSEGTVRLAGERVSGWSAHRVARAGVSLVREGAPVFGELTILENIKLGTTLARRRGVTPGGLDDVWQIFPALEAMAGRRAGLLSGGQRQMLAMATAIVSKPAILLLDEPSGGLAPEAAAKAFEAIANLRARGLCVLIAEQNVDWLVGITTRTIELESGRMIADEPAIMS